MARAWRIEYEGALYHVLSRGNDRQVIVINKYAKEEQRAWEDLRHGIFVGTVIHNPGKDQVCHVTLTIGRREELTVYAISNCDNFFRRIE